MLLSVVMPAYNAGKTIKESIDSILNQSFKDFEFIIINDGSTDNTEDVILSYGDKRIRYLKNDVNRGIIYTLNRGIIESKGKYIARMDSDDISLSTRFEKQIAILESRPNVIVCGTLISPFGSKTKKTNLTKLQLHNLKMKEQLAITTCFAHPTVIIRKFVLLSNDIKYDENFKNAEDYKLWIDLMEYGEYYTVSEKLLLYRFSDSQISQTNNPITEKSVSKCRELYLLKFVDKFVVSDIRQYGINIHLITKIKKQTDNKKIIEAAYLSLNNYGLKEIIYYIFSLDLFSLGYMVAMRFCKRLIKGKMAIYEF